MNKTTFKNNSINWESIYSICIVKTLARLGHIPCRTTEEEAWFLRPFRSETRAFFSVCLRKNLWYDFGSGEGGSVIGGIFDFLSLAVLKPQLIAMVDCLVLNSLSIITDGHPLLLSYKKVLLFLDNDSAGRRSVQELFSRYSTALDYSSCYSDFIDTNDWLAHGKR